MLRTSSASRGPQLHTTLYLAARRSASARQRSAPQYLSGVLAPTWSTAYGDFGAAKAAPARVPASSAGLRGVGELGANVGEVRWPSGKVKQLVGYPVFPAGPRAAERDDPSGAERARIDDIAVLAGHGAGAAAGSIEACQRVRMALGKRQRHHTVRAAGEKRHHFGPRSRVDFGTAVACAQAREQGRQHQRVAKEKLVDHEDAAWVGGAGPRPQANGAQRRAAETAHAIQRARGHQ
jgi:hypothetical protein